MNDENIFNQNKKKLVAINDGKNIGQRGTKVLDSSV